MTLPSLGKRASAALSAASLAWLVASCATNPGTAAITADAARRFSCPESQITVDDLGPRTARARGCGQVQRYACKDAQRAESPGSGALVPEHEARSRPAGPSRCTWSAAQ
jgi:hypothetical protein